MNYKSVSEFLVDLPPDKRKVVELLRQYIVQAEPTLIENVKWNAPNYAFEGTDRITFNLRNKEHVVQIIIHKGAIEKEDKKATPILEDPSGLIQWNSNIRGTLSFRTLQDVDKHSQELKQIIKNWLSL